MKLMIMELTRLRWRRATLMLMVAAVVLPLFFFAGTAWETRPHSGAEIREARSQMEMNNEGMPDMLADCVKNPGDFGIPDGADIEQECEMSFVGDDDINNYLWRPQLSLDYVLEGPGPAVAVFMVVLAMMLGTTYAGADWATGSMSNQLLFESRRVRVWFAKAAATLLGGLILAVVGLAVFWALTAGWIAVRDVPVAGGQWADVLQQCARVTGLAAAGAVGGFAITMLFRSTVATLGLMLALAIGGSLLVELLPIDDPVPWTFYGNALAILQGGYSYYSPIADMCTDFDCSATDVTLSATHGAVFFGVVLLVAGALSISSFRRRDVP